MTQAPTGCVTPWQRWRVRGRLSCSDCAGVSSLPSSAWYLTFNVWKKKTVGENVFGSWSITMFLSRCLPPGLFHLLFPGLSDPENWWLLVPTVGVLCGLGYGSLLSNTHTHLGCDQDLSHRRLHQTGIVLLQHESKHVAFPFIFNMFWVFKGNYCPLLAHINHCYVFTLIYIYFLFWIFISKTFLSVLVDWLLVVPTEFQSVLGLKWF